MRDGLAGVAQFITTINKQLAEVTRSIGDGETDNKSGSAVGGVSLKHMKESLRDKFDYGVEKFDDKSNAVPLTELGVFLLQGRACDEAIDTLCEIPYYVKQSKWLKRHLTMNALKTVMSSILQPAAAKRVSELLATILPDGWNPKLTFVGNEKAWGNEIFDKQFFAACKDFLSSGTTAYGIGELRYIINGEETVAGLPLGVCPGGSIAQKVAFLSGASVSQFGTLLGVPGFFRAHLTKGSMLAVPAGYMVLNVSSDSQGSEGLRWGYWPAESSEAARGKVIEVVESSMESYKEFRNHVGLKECVAFLKRLSV